MPSFHPSRLASTPRKTSGWLLGMVAAALVIELVLVVGVRADLVRTLCEQGPIRLHVAASLDIAPAVQQIGRHFNDLNRDVGGHCAQVEVTEERPRRRGGQPSGVSTIVGESPIDAWIPDSSLWVDVVRSSARGAAAGAADRDLGRPVPARHRGATGYRRHHQPLIAARRLADTLPAAAWRATGLAAPADTAP